MVIEVPCPRCKKAIVAREDEPLPRDFPFCSERCRLLDLGKWFDEEHRISRPVRPGEMGTPTGEE